MKKPASLFIVIAILVITVGYLLYVAVEVLTKEDYNKLNPDHILMGTVSLISLFQIVLSWFLLRRSNKARIMLLITGIPVFILLALLTQFSVSTLDGVYLKSTVWTVTLYTSLTAGMGVVLALLSSRKIKDYTS